MGNQLAQAKTIIGYKHNNGNTHYFEGVVNGHIVSPRGKGFGWDAIFQPVNYAKTFGEMTPEEKNKISMRKLAAQKLKDFLVK